MPEITIPILVYVLLPTIVGAGAYFMKSFLDRVHTLEIKVQDKINETECRQLLSDKLDPLVNEIKDLKIQVTKIIDLLIEGKTS